MRIGLFTDSYRPAINGVVYVVESTKNHLEALGHEVFIFCPARSIRPSKHAIEFEEDEHVIRFPSIKGVAYDDYDMTLFFPPRVVKLIDELNLDVIHFFTPGQVGLMAAHAAFKCDIPIVAQYCTDLHEYVKHYHDGTLLPGILALVTIMPFTVKVDAEDIREIAKLYRPRRARVDWNMNVVEKCITLVYSKCDAVIALSRKSKEKLESWQKYNAKYHYDVTLKPDGVDALKKPTDQQMAQFREEFGIAKDDQLVTFVGRLAPEKNLDMLIPMIERIVSERPKARLLFVGDFEYRAKLEAKAKRSKARNRITFTGALPRESLGTVYGTSDVFVFPSLTDTQAWVLHESTHAGLPVVMADHGLSEVVHDGENGYIVKNKPAAFAEAVVKLLKSPKLREQFGAASKKLALAYTERKQVRKLEKIYLEAIKAHHRRSDLTPPKRRRRASRRRTNRLIVE